VDSFNYLSVLLSIILGLAITPSPAGLARAHSDQGEGEVIHPDLNLGWAHAPHRHSGVVGEFRYAHAGKLDLCGPPRYPASSDKLVHGRGAGPTGHLRETTVDLRQHYFAHKSWLFGSLFVSIVFSAAKDFALTGHMIGGTNAGFHVIFGLAAIVAAITRQEWFHKLLAPAVALLFFLYIALLFARL
jgi:hypothetical protein